MSDVVLSFLQQHRIVAVVRGIAPDLADATADALVEGCIRLIEVTMNSPDALEIIARWDERYEGQAIIGAGTVLDVEMAQQAIEAGAQYLIAPSLDEDVVRYGVEHGIEVWPGVMTPTEIVRAIRAGANAVKVFPAATLGPRYFQEVRGPLNDVPLIAVGGVSVDNAASFLEAGAVGIGVGGNLVNKQLIEERKFDELTVLARQYVSAVAAVCEMEARTEAEPPEGEDA